MACVRQSHAFSDRRPPAEAVEKRGIFFLHAPVANFVQQLLRPQEEEVTFSSLFHRFSSISFPAPQ